MNKAWQDRLKLLLLAGLLLPAIMIAVGLGLHYWKERTLFDLLRWPDLQAAGLGMLIAVFTMGAITLLSKVNKTLERALRESSVKVGVDALSQLGYPVMAVMVVLNGVGEEALFRGGLQPIIGLVPAALLFGFSHGGWRRGMWAYVLVAALSGGVFGLAYRITGDLWVPAFAHATHNILSLALMGKKLDFRWEGALPRVRLIADEPVSDEDEEMEELLVKEWPTPYTARPTIRETGLTVGILPTGPQNDLCDVPGVLVGHATVVEGDGPLVPGQGPVRTGVTAILPHDGNLFMEKVPAGVFVLNGFGKSIGLAQVQELGNLETPILLTNTLSAFRAADALVSYMVEQNPGIGINTSTVNPVVGECNDGKLNDIQGRHVTEEHVRHALSTATSGPVQQGAVGAGTGVTCFGFKGGIGSASRQVEGYTLGALVQANFGRRGDLLVAGTPVGQELLTYPEEAAVSEGPPGSIMIVLATDAPLDARQLNRLCKRGAMGLARVGGSAANGSGDFIIGFSTANRVAHGGDESVVAMPCLTDDSAALSRLFLAAVEAVEEAVLNAMWCAQTVVGRDGNVSHAIPTERIISLLKRAHP